MDLTDRVALVTGGTRGIGAAIAADLARRGSHVAIVARSLGEAAEAVRRSVQGAGRECLALAGDLTQEDDCSRVVVETAKWMGRLDVLVHNAGGPSPGRLEQVSTEQWRQTMDLHINANFFLFRAALPHLRRQGAAAIVTVSSSAGIRGVPGAIAYATAKGALPQFTRCLARDLADDNIRVNGVAPGVIRTRFHDDMSAERKKLNLEQRIPLHREGTPRQVAEVVGLLVTNDYITGETFVIDGGLTSRIA